MAIIQNISTEAVTMFTGPQGAGGAGTILNPASLTGQGGGNLPVGNIDLHELFFVRATGGDTLSVYYEI